MFAKVEVNGDGACDLYRLLKAEQSGDVAWNFTKFLVNRNGVVVARFEPQVTPQQVAERLDELL